jgi:hypothetical protein
LRTDFNNKSISTNVKNKFSLDSMIIKYSQLLNCN